MRLHRVLALVAVVMLLATVSFGQKRTEKGSLESSGTDLVGQCEGFNVLTDYFFRMIWINHFDKNGELLRTRYQWKIIGESVYYNSEDLNKAVTGGPGEVSNQSFDPATGQIRVTGIVYKVKIPGYGLVFAETGALVWQCDDPYTFTNCVMVSNTGHNQYAEGDVAALCDYLK